MITSYNKLRGFTLIELLVVISIIGVLASVVLSALNTARMDAKYTVVKSDVRQISNAITMAQGHSGKDLWGITGSRCSDCICRTDRGTGNLMNLPESHACFTQWRNALTRIAGDTGGIIKDLSSYKRDPWGSPYLLDENERERGCTKDVLRSAGADGFAGTTDDFWFAVETMSPSCR